MGLAPILVERIFEIIVEINKQGTPILLVEQNALMALDVAQRGYVLETGRIALADSAKALRDERAGAQDLPRRGLAPRRVSVARCGKSPQTRKGGGVISEAILFDRDQVDHLETLAERPGRLSGSKLLWVDLRLERRDGDRRRRGRGGVRPRRDDAGVPREAAREVGLRRPRPLHPHHDVRAARGRGGRAARASVRRRRELGDHGARPAHPGARGVRDSRLRLRRHRVARRPELPGGVARAGSSARTRPRSSGSSSASRSSTSTRCAARAPTATSRRCVADAPAGGDAAARTRGPPLRARRAHASGARGARRQRVRRALPVALRPLRGDAAGGARRARGDRRLLRRPHRPRRAPHERRS